MMSYSNFKIKEDIKKKKTLTIYSIWSPRWKLCKYTINNLFMILGNVKDTRLIIPKIIAVIDDHLKFLRVWNPLSNSIVNVLWPRLLNFWIKKKIFKWYLLSSAVWWQNASLLHWRSWVQPRVGSPRIFKIYFLQQKLSSLSISCDISKRMNSTHCSVQRQVKDPGHPWMNRVCARLPALSFCHYVCLCRISYFRSIA